MILTSPADAAIALTERKQEEILLGLSDCEGCGSPEGVAAEASRTAYHYEGEPGTAEDPNRPIRLCRACAEEHHANWDAMWSEYYSGCL